MSCYIHGDGTFDLHAVVVWGGGNLYNLNEIEREMIFYKTMKEFFFPTYSVLEKSAYHLIVAISVELPRWELVRHDFTLSTNTIHYCWYAKENCVFALDWNKTMYHAISCTHAQFCSFLYCLLRCDMVLVQLGAGGGNPA